MANDKIFVFIPRAADYRRMYLQDFWMAHSENEARNMVAWLKEQGVQAECCDAVKCEEMAADSD